MTALSSVSVKRLSEFVRALPVGMLETTTRKDAKDAVMPFFNEWVEVWKAHKPFFRCVLVFAWGMVMITEGRSVCFCFYTCGPGGSSSRCLHESLFRLYLTMSVVGVFPADKRSRTYSMTRIVTKEQKVEERDWKEQDAQTRSSVISPSAAEVEEEQERNGAEMTKGRLGKSQDR